MVLPPFDVDARLPYPTSTPAKLLIAPVETAKVCKALKDTSEWVPIVKFQSAEITELAAYLSDSMPRVSKALESRIPRL